jgi:hypothetical protein
MNELQRRLTRCWASFPQKAAYEKVQSSPYRLNQYIVAVFWLNYSETSKSHSYLFESQRL